MRIVMDTNVVVSAVLLPQSVAKKAYRKAFLFGSIFYSQPILEELSAVLTRKKFDRYCSLEERINFLFDFQRDAVSVAVEIKTEACRDPKDNMLLEVALTVKADYLITGDKDLLVLSPFEHTNILTPGDFLTIN